jgi:mannosyl-3-phosphoglycerate phosphatase
MSSRLTLIFTDLDGTLLNQHDYQFDAALPVLHQLHQQNIPVIPVTSKTRAEVEWIRQQVAPNDPFIVENGSAIFYVKGDRRFMRSQHCVDTDSSFDTVHLGCSYADARRGLAQLSQCINQALQGFSDLTENALTQLTGLSHAEVQRAKHREFTEPFVTPHSVSAAVLQTTVEQIGFRIVVGDRFSHLIGPNAGKGHAVHQIIDAYRAAHPNHTIQTLGLGNSPNDLELLEAVDQAIVVPGESGVHPALRDRGWAIAPFAGCRGWAASVTRQLKTLHQ